MTETPKTETDRSLLEAKVLSLTEEDGLYRQDTVQRKHTATDSELQQAATISNMKRNNEQVWNLEKKIFEPIVRFFLKLLALLGVK